MVDLILFNSMNDLTLVQLVGELRTLERYLKTINKRLTDVSHQISSKIETAETLINKDDDDDDDLFIDINETGGKY